ncbi:lipopolysaccharide biosynthesis protein [Allosphingosinicella indica]|uniref:Membrane protein involved in the export of O-antigen and teichoic acid n=1 Tax=Allosphingosinicella indica TaxID=941907 RepID=A0A1X7GS31_9SPHN|nr:oligosaccharide flippase family protein [Allosphingosinicella indica]SMF73896.1 Membrane protein involved in the export of O-antigen and teichoic acid [Allosphingosinicella indica]
MSEAAPAVSRGDMARGAGLAGLARLGAVIEALAQPLFTWLFGLATYGIYVVLWGAINFVSNIVDLSMTSAMQRLVPTAGGDRRAEGLVKGAMLIAMTPAILVALAVSLNAESVAALFSAAPVDRARLPHIVALFAWALPLWTFVEVATSAARARRAFGPEIRLRIFWEQIARILFALGFFLAGFTSEGLMLAHLCSLALTAGLSVPLLARYYDLGALLRAPVPFRDIRALVGTGLALMPADVSRRLLIDGPPVVLNLMLPGTRGATAAGLFEIARKLSTIPLVVRQAFQYVMAPLASAQAHVDRAEIAPLYRFASRVSTAMVVPLAGLLIFAGPDILSVYRPEAAAALPLLTILVAARAAEAIVGPATPIVEMTGHRALPLVNSLIGVGLGAALAALLVPAHGALGMAIAVAAATVTITYAATLELRFSDGLSPFDRKLLIGFSVAIAGVALMALAEQFTRGPARFVSVTLLWVMTSWVALRLGLTRTDREALGGIARRLRLLPS